MVYLAKAFPILSNVKNLYQFHYLYNRLSRIAGEAHSTFSICFDSMKKDPYSTFGELFRLCNIKKMTVNKAVSLLVLKQRKGTDIQKNSWYMEQESSCEDLWVKEYGKENPVDAVTNQIISANLVECDSG